MIRFLQCSVHNNFRLADQINQWFFGSIVLYCQHARFAFGVSLRLFGAAFAALVHAILPWTFEKTASTIVADLHQRTHDRGR